MKKNNKIIIDFLKILLILVTLGLVIFLIIKGGILFMVYNSTPDYIITREVCHNETIINYYNFHGDYRQVQCPNIPCYDSKGNIIIGAQCIDSQNFCWKFKDSSVDNYTYKEIYEQAWGRYGEVDNHRIITRVEDSSYILDNTFPKIIKENYTKQVCEQQEVDEIILVHNLQPYSIQKFELTREWIDMYCKRELSEIKNFTKWVGEHSGISWECFGEYKTGDIIYTKSDLSQKVKGHKTNQFIYDEKEIPEEYKVYSNVYSCPDNYKIEVLE